MSNLQLVEALCSLVESFAQITCAMAKKLEQISAFDDADRNAVNEVMVRYSEILGTDEVPGGFNVPATSGNQQWAKSHGVDQNAPWLILPNATGGSDASYIPDGWWSNTGWRIFFVGGDLGGGSPAGLFARHASDASSSASALIGGRLLYIP